MNRNLRQRGFTLIELLIVIVIIGILSGVLIAVINPVRQQNRSRNATLQASINKAAFAINTARAGMGRLPANADLDVELENFTYGDNCDEDDTEALDCTFNLAGTVLPRTCSTDWGGEGGGQCEFYVIADSTTNPGDDLHSPQFLVIAKKWQLDPSTDDEEIYVYSAREGFYECIAANVGVDDLMDDIPYDSANPDTSDCRPIH